MTEQLTQPNMANTLRENVWRFAKYCNSLSPWKLDDPKDPLVESTINDFADELFQLIQRKQVEAEVEGMRKARNRVIKRTEIPADAKNPTRDIIVLTGEECARIIDEDIAELNKELEEKQS